MFEGRVVEGCRDRRADYVEAFVGIGRAKIHSRGAEKMVIVLVCRGTLGDVWSETGGTSSDGWYA